MEVHGSLFDAHFLDPSTQLMIVLYGNGNTVTVQSIDSSVPALT